MTLGRPTDLAADSDDDGGGTIVFLGQYSGRSVAIGTENPAVAAVSSRRWPREGGDTENNVKCHWTRFLVGDECG